MLKFIMISALLFLTINQASAQSTALPSSDTTQLVLLGVGNPNPVPERSGPASAIIVNGQAYIIDFGPGIMRRAEKARQELGIETLSAARIRHAFLTHLHWDHSAGLPDLLLTGWTMGREEPLELFGPPGTKSMGHNIIRAYVKDINIRVNGLEPATESGWEILSTEGVTGVIYEDENISVEAFKVCHGGFENSLGYKFTTPDRVIVISGDTGYCPIVAEKAKGADILLHEVYSSESYKHLPENWATYHASFHTSSQQLAQIAKEAKPKLLVLHHQLVWGGDSYELPFEELNKIYDGAIINGKDLDVF